MPPTSAETKVEDPEYSNWLRVCLALYYLKDGLHSFIQREVNAMHQSVLMKLYGSSVIPRPKCSICKSEDVKQNRNTYAWKFRSPCPSHLCDAWLTELLTFHKNPTSTKICWKNCDVTGWPFHPWECAKLYMPRGQPQANIIPSHSDAQALVTLMATCTYFHGKLSPAGIKLTCMVSIIRNSVMHSGDMRLSDGDRKSFINDIIQLLQDPVHLLSLEQCKQAVDEINKINDDSLDVLFSHEKKALRECMSYYRQELGIHKKDTEATVESLKEEVRKLKDQFDNHAKETKHEIQNLNAKCQKFDSSVTIVSQSTSSDLGSIKQELSRHDNEIQKLKASSSEATKAADQVLAENIESGTACTRVCKLEDRSIRKAWQSVETELLEELAPLCILSYLDFLSENDCQAIRCKRKRREMTKKLLPRVKENLCRAFSVLLDALVKTGNGYLVGRLIDIVQGTGDLNTSGYQPAGTFSSATITVDVHNMSLEVKFNMKTEDVIISHNVEKKIKDNFKEGSSAFSFDLTSKVDSAICSSVIIHLQPLSKHALETLAFFCQNGGMKDYVLNLLKKKDIFASLPMGEVCSIEVRVVCHKEDIVSEGAHEPEEDFASEKFDVVENPQVIKNNLLLQYGSLLEEIEALHLQETFIGSGILDRSFFKELTDMPRRARAAQFLKEVFQKGSDALMALVQALKDSGREDLSTKLCCVEKRTPDLGDTGQVDDNLVQLVREASQMHSDEAVMWSCHLDLLIGRHTYGSRSKENECSVANVEAGAIGLPKSLVGSRLRYRYRQLLQGLAEDLTSDEVSQLVFLLRFRIKGKKARSEIKSDATKLLTELEKLNCIGVDILTLLVELFELIGRTDLRNRIAEELGHNYQASKHEINEFMRTLWKFGQKLDSDDLKNAKFLLGWTQDKEITEAVWQMFEKAFERGLLEENNINSIKNFAESIKQRERLRSVLKQDPFSGSTYNPGITSIQGISQDPFMYTGITYNPGITSTQGISQGEYPYTRVGMTPRKEERPLWQPAQAWSENYLTGYLHTYTGNDNNPYHHQVSVPHEDDMSVPLSAAIQNPHGARYLPLPLTPENPVSITEFKTVENFPRQDASARQKEAGHNTYLRDSNEQIASLELFGPQNTLDKIREGKNIQNEEKDVREIGVRDSSSDNVNLPARQAAPTGTQFKGKFDSSDLITNEDPVSEQVFRRDEQKEASKDIQTGGGYEEAIHLREMVNTSHLHDNVNLTGEQGVATETTNFRATLQDVINAEPKSVQASKRGEEKEAGQEIKSSGRDEKQMSELNISGSHLDFPGEVKESKSIQNEAIDVRDMANTGSLGVTSHLVTNNQNEVIDVRDMANPGSLGVTSHLVISNHNEASPEVKIDVNEDPKVIREMPHTGQSPVSENLRLGQTVQTETGSFSGPFDTPAYIISQDSRHKGASQIDEQKGESQEIISSILIEEKISKLNLSKESNASSNETREIKDLINSGHLDNTYAQDEERIYGNINQSNNGASSESKQDSFVQTSTSDENSHVGNGREGHSLFDTSLFSSGHARTSESEGGDANGKQEAIDGQNLNFISQGHGDSRTFETSNIFPTTKRQAVCSPNYPRYGQIITMTVEEMTGYIGKEIGKGGFGTVYKAKMPSKEKCKFAIKEIKVSEELFQKSYDKEIHHGRILHPFINPIIARAESLPTKFGIGISYLMYPYMKNRELRCNIDRVNNKEKLCPNESNAKIWSRCIYQIVQAVDFLHKPVASVRGPIFHRDLTSRNIFLDENFNVRIGDFGIAVEAKWNATHATMTKILGTEGYHPPSMNPYEYNASYDVFSVGVVMLEILTGLEARMKEDPHYLYKKYNYEGGYEDLIEDLDMRAEENEAAGWSNIPRRDKFAEIALQAVGLDETQSKTISLLQKLEEMRLDSSECYRKSANRDRCVSCCINPRAKLSTKGRDCLGNERNNPCQHFCVLCLMNHHFNPLVCPQHGKTRPPFGDHVYAVFVAGNNVDDTQQYPGSKGTSHDIGIAQMFSRNVQKVVQVLTAKHPFVLGASKQNVRVVMPEKPGTKDEIETKIKKAFEDLNAAIKQAIQMENLDPEKDRLPNSLFIFYFSGHCTAEEGLYLGSTEETLKASAPWIQEMLHFKLGVDQIVVVLDCCHADSQNFTDTHGLNAMGNFTDGREKASIVQLSSCDVRETSSAKFEGEGPGSYFTHFFCLGLLGLDSVGSEDDTVMFCNECEKSRKSRDVIDITLPCGKYHSQCLSDHGVTFSAMKKFIQGHFERLRGVTSGPAFMTQVHNAQGEKEVFLAYYNPCKWHIPIHLKGSEVSHNFCLSSHPDSMDKLRQDIIKHTVETKLDSDVLKFHQSYEKDSSHLIAIHPKYGSDKDSELISLDNIYKARSCSRELEVRVRDNVSGISNGPVKLSKINITMGINPGKEINDHHLKINQSFIQIDIDSIVKVKADMRKMKLSSHYHNDFNTLIEEVIGILRGICSCDSGSLLKKEKGNVLKVYLYKEFSVLAIESGKTCQQ